MPSANTGGMHSGSPRRAGYVDVVPATSGVRFTKHHGLGNDFLVALVPQHVEVPVDAAFARTVCDRRRGVGADGLLFATAISGDAEVGMVLLNSDGSRAEISGNGLRCLGQAVLRDRGLRSGELAVRTAVGVRRLRSEPTDDPLVDLIEAEMGMVRPGPEVSGLPTDTMGGLDVIDIIGLEIGNPHIVVRVPSLHDADPARFGPPIEAAVAGGVNVHVLAEEGTDTIRLRHWERGAGVTEACGSGACVSAVAARGWGLCGDEVRVLMPGGEATVLLDGHEARLRGTATLVGEVILA